MVRSSPLDWPCEANCYNTSASWLFACQYVWFPGLWGLEVQCLLEQTSWEVSFHISAQVCFAPSTLLNSRPVIQYLGLSPLWDPSNIVPQTQCTPCRIFLYFVIATCQVVWNEPFEAGIRCCDWTRLTWFSYAFLTRKIKKVIANGWHFVNLHPYLNETLTF